MWPHRFRLPYHSLGVHADDSLIMAQVRFAISSSPVFSRTDTATDSETFYLSILELLEDPEEKSEVEELISWWNR